MNEKEKSENHPNEAAFVPPSPDDHAPLSYSLAILLSTVLLLEGQAGANQIRSDTFARNLFHGVVAVRKAAQAVIGIIYWKNPLISGVTFSAIAYNAIYRLFNACQ